MILGNIPDELRRLPQWVCRRGKVPYNPRTGSRAKAGKADTWVTFEEAVQAADRYDGIGFEFNNNGLVGIDLDTVRDPITGWIDPLALEIIAQLDSYTEISPSGYGFHIIARASDLRIEWKERALPANQIVRPDIDPKTGEIRKDKDGNPQYKRPQIEMYIDVRYFTVTGNVFDGRGVIKDATSAAQELQQRFVNKPTEGGAALSWDSVIGAADSRNDYLSDGLKHDAKLRELWYGGRPNGNESADDQALMNKLAYWLNCDRSQMKAAFLSSPHFASKDDAHQRKAAERADYLDRTIERAVKDCKDTAAASDARYKDRKLKEDFGADPDEEFLKLFKPVSEFEEQEAEWLIPGWIPKGQVAIMAADGGVGKTSVCCNIAAAITSGGCSILDPVGTKREPSKVLLLTTEDSIKKKLRKKYRLAGANLQNLIAPDLAADVKGDLRDFKFGKPLFLSAIRKCRPALCIIDPVQGYVPADINMGSRNAMRDCLAPLAQLGEEIGCTFIVICHSNKRRGASGRERISDSSDLWDIARSVIMAGFTKEDGVRYLSNEKNNYAELQRTILYRMNNNGLPEFVDFSDKRDRDFMAEAFFSKKSEEKPVNEALIAALKEEANPFEPVKFSYATWEEKHGATLWGGKQPKKALDEVKPLLEADGYSLITKSVKIGRKSANGFVLSMTTEPKQEELAV